MNELVIRASSVSEAAAGAPGWVVPTLIAIGVVIVLGFVIGIIVTVSRPKRSRRGGGGGYGGDGGGGWWWWWGGSSFFDDIFDIFN